MNKALEEYLTKHDRLLLPTSPEECISLLVNELGHGSYYFRGVSNSQYELLSSLDRVVSITGHYIFGNGISNRPFREQYFFREFKKVAHNYLPSGSMPKSILSWLALMQHFGIPTRLIDVTRSPFVALYFAVNDWRDAHDGAVWAISPHKIHENTFHRLSSLKFPFALTDSNYNFSQMPDFLKDAYFREAFMTDKYPILSILGPEQMNPRINAQQGAFLVRGQSSTSTEQTLVDLIHDQSHLDPREREMLKRNKIDMTVRRIIVPQKFKKKILIQLHRMNIHAGTLFPGLEGASIAIRERGTVEEWESHMQSVEALSGDA